MRWFGAVLMAGALALAGCASTEAPIPDGAEPLGNDFWQLIDESPDGHRLLIETIGLEFPSGFCGGATDWTWDQTDDLVTVSRLLWLGDSGTVGCSSSVAGGFSLVELDEPLGGRTLEGCRRANCGQRLNSSNFDPLRVEAIDGYFVVSTNTGPVAVDAEGNVEATAVAESLFESAAWNVALERRRTPSFGAHEVVVDGTTVVGGQDMDAYIRGADGQVIQLETPPLGPPAEVWNRLALFDRGARLTAVDIDTGELTWIGRGLGVEWTVTDDAIFSIRRRSLLRVDPNTADVTWRVDLGPPGMHAVAADGDLVVVSSPLHLDAYDAESGELRWSANLPWHAGERTG
jgi:hypothetical protein